MARRGRRGRRTGSQRRASQRAKRASRSPSKSSTSSKSKSKSTKKKSRKPMGRSRHTPGGQHAANKNQNKKAKRTVKSVKKAVSKRLGNIGKKVKKGFSIGKAAYGKAFKGLAANAATHVANSQYNKQLKKANWTKRDMNKLTPQQQRKYERLSKITGRDYSMRRPTFKLNLNADTLARFGGFADSGWYKGITSRFPGIKKLKINKQFYGNPMKKGWHSSQRPGRGQGISSVAEMIGGKRAAQAARAQARLQNEAVERQFEYDNQQYRNQYTTGVERGMGPQQDWLSQLYSSHNINRGKLDQGARDYWTNEAKTKGRDAVIKSIIGTSKAQGTYGGRKKPRRINTGTTKAVPLPIGLLGSVTKAKRAKQHHRQQNRAVQRSYDLQAKGHKRRQGMLANTIAATMAARGM